MKKILMMLAIAACAVSAQAAKTYSVVATNGQRFNPVTDAAISSDYTAKVSSTTPGSYIGYYKGYALSKSEAYDVMTKNGWSGTESSSINMDVVTDWLHENNNAYFLTRAGAWKDASDKAGKSVSATLTTDKTAQWTFGAESTQADANAKFAIVCLFYQDETDPPSNAARVGNGKSLMHVKDDFASGWLTGGKGYTPAPAPEPTSGLLLLLGVAGLALKRRRA